jgi:hypothetical protein
VDLLAQLGDELTLKLRKDCCSIFEYFLRRGLCVEQTGICQGDTTCDGGSFRLTEQILLITIVVVLFVVRCAGGSSLIEDVFPAVAAVIVVVRCAVGSRLAEHVLPAVVAVIVVVHCAGRSTFRSLALFV